MEKAQQQQQQPPSTPPLRRRNSIATSVVVPANLTLPSKTLHTSSLPTPHTIGAATSPSPPLDLELVSLKASLSSYTSLKDLLPSTPVNSPTPAAAASSASAYEISIRNRLVKQAAWAYLQPMSSSPSSSGTNFFRRVWLQFSARNPISACIRFIARIIIPSIAGGIDRIFCAIRVRMPR